MPLAEEYTAMFDQLAEQEPTPAIWAMTTAQARATYSAMRPTIESIPVGSCEDRTITGTLGDIPIRIYTPEGEGPFGLLMNFHGGGWVIGDLDTADAVCRQLTTLANVVVISVGYRKAPEAPYPAAVIDAYDATQWVSDHAQELRGNGKLGVTGESAGGNLSAVVCQKARDDNGPKIDFQCLLYPVTDCDFNRASYRENGEGYLLETKTMTWFWDHYCADHKQRQEAYACPLRAADLAHLPPALVITAEFDPLRDEGEAYAEALRAAGNAAASVCYDGLVHDFMATAAAFECSAVALMDTAGVIKQHLTQN